jgi:hypothetical protein
MLNTKIAEMVKARDTRLWHAELYRDAEKRMINDVILSALDHDRGALLVRFNGMTVVQRIWDAPDDVRVLLEDEDGHALSYLLRESGVVGEYNYFLAPAGKYWVLRVYRPVAPSWRAFDYDVQHSAPADEIRLLERYRGLSESNPQNYEMWFGVRLSVEDLDTYGNPLRGNLALVDFLKSALGDVVASVSCGDSHGDYLMLTRKGGKYGYVTVGYGSCEACDVWKGSETFEALLRFRNSVACNTHWEESASRMRTWLSSHDWAGDFVGYYADDVRVFLEKAHKALMEVRA